MDYDLITLLDVLRVQKVPNPFWLTQFFPMQINFDTEKIAFDRVTEEYRRRAPFVAPNVQGKVMTTEGYDTLAFKPPYVKPKHIVDPDVMFVRQPGEALGAGTMTPLQRKDAAVAGILARHRAMHTMTREWMAAKAVIDGKVTVEGDGYPKVTVDFKRDASLTVVLAGAALWSASTATPLDDIYELRATANNLCGAIVRDVIFGANAWALFKSFTDVQKLLEKDIRGSETEFTKLNDGFPDTTEYVGKLVGSGGAGLIRLWVHTGKYVEQDASGADVQHDMLDTNTVVGVDGPMLQGHRCFGAIRDGKAGFKALEMFPKMWEEEDPWVEFLMTQSAPLMVPKQPNASFSIKVAA